MIIQSSVLLRASTQSSSRLRGRSHRLPANLRGQSAAHCVRLNVLKLRQNNLILLVLSPSLCLVPLKEPASSLDLFALTLMAAPIKDFFNLKALKPLSLLLTVLPNTTTSTQLTFPMSSVAFFGVYDSMDPGRSVVGNGIPQRYQDGTGHPEVYLFTTTLKEALEFYWQTNKVTLNTDFEVVAGGNSVALPNDEFDVAPVDEADLVFTNTIRSFLDAVIGEYELIFQLFTGFPGIDLTGDDQPALAFDGTDYFPGLRIHGNLSVQDASDPMNVISASIAFDTVEANLGSSTAVTASLDGHEFTLWVETTEVNGGVATASIFEFTTTGTYPYNP